MPWTAQVYVVSVSKEKHVYQGNEGSVVPQRKVSFIPCCAKGQEAHLSAFPLITGRVLLLPLHNGFSSASHLLPPLPQGLPRATSQQGWQPSIYPSARHCLIREHCPIILCSEGLAMLKCKLQAALCLNCAGIPATSNSLILQLRLSFVLFCVLFKT